VEAPPTPRLQVTGLYGMPSWGQPWEGTNVPLAIEEKGTVRIPLSNLVGRSLRLEVPRGAVEFLTSSIRYVGLVRPLYVARIEGTPNYEVLDGNLRLEALRKIDPTGKLSVPCVVVHGDERKRTLLQHASAVQYRHSPFELFYSLRKHVLAHMDEERFLEVLKSLLKYSDGQDEVKDPLIHASLLVLSRVVGAYGLTPYEAYRQWRFYQRVPPKVKRLFEEGKLPLSFMRVLASRKTTLLPEEAQERLLEMALTLEPTPYGVAKLRKAVREELEAHLGGYQVAKIASQLQKRYGKEVAKELARLLLKEED
jgi:hypothetical protein